MKIQSLHQKYVLVINYLRLINHKISKRHRSIIELKEDLKTSSKHFLSVFLFSLGLPTCFVNLSISILEDALNALDVVVVLAIRSISAQYEEKKILECYLNGWAFLQLRKGNPLFYQKPQLKLVYHLLSNIDLRMILPVQCCFPFSVQANVGIHR